ncbi:MAG TPA: SDR family oxidoreductase [Polyangiaceae bacterium]|nr:SDR family oxidoreductase [Polyangiaceae bacterium]
MNIIIPGGGGYIGVLLTEQLLEQGHEVTVFDRFYFGIELFDRWRANPRLRLVKGDVRTIKPDVFRGADAVIQLAALSNDPTADLDPELTRAINMVGTIRCAELAKDAGVKRYLFSSSCSVYGDSHDVVDETSATNPVSLYARYKLEAETALDKLASKDFIVSSLRNATVYGVSPRMRFDLVVNIMTLYAWKQRKIFVLGGGRQWRPLVHVRDVANAFVVLLGAPGDVINRKVFNVGEDAQNYQVRDIANIVCNVVPNTVVEDVPDDPDKRSYRTAFKKAEAELGFKVKYTVEQGAKEVLNALQGGQIQDEIKTKTLAYYKYLLEAERLVKDLSLDGKIL